MGCGGSKPRVEDGGGEQVETAPRARPKKAETRSGAGGGDRPSNLLSRSGTPGAGFAVDAEDASEVCATAMFPRSGVRISAEARAHHGVHSFAMWQSIGDVVLDDADANAVGGGQSSDAATDVDSEEADSRRDDAYADEEEEEEGSEREGDDDDSTTRATAMRVETTFVAVPVAAGREKDPTASHPFSPTVTANDEDAALERAAMGAGVAMVEVDGDRASTSSRNLDGGAREGVEDGEDGATVRLDRVSSLGVEGSASIDTDTAFTAFELLEDDSDDEDDDDGSDKSGDGDGDGHKKRYGKGRGGGLDRVDELELNERLRAAFGDDAAAGWSYANDFEEIHQLGRGAFGEVSLARRLSDGLLVAVKRVNLGALLGDEKALTDAKHEATMLAGLHHPNVVQCHGATVDGAVLHIAMEYLSGGDLASLIERRAAAHEPLAEQEVLSIFTQLALAVHYIHAQGILHRDLKTANVFLAPGGIAKLGDFGIARVLSSSESAAGLANTVIGTPYYLSPEMCEGLPYDQKSDVWSMGCVLYELMTLRRAFDGSSLPALVLNIVKGEYPEPPRELFSQELRSLLRWMLARDPAERPSAEEVLSSMAVRPQVREFAAALRESLNGRPALLASDPSFADYALRGSGDHEDAVVHVVSAQSTRAYLQTSAHGGGGAEDGNSTWGEGRGNGTTSVRTSMERAWDWDSRPAVSAMQTAKQQQELSESNGRRLGTAFEASTSYAHDAPSDTFTDKSFPPRPRAGWADAEAAAAVSTRGSSAPTSDLGHMADAAGSLGQYHPASEDVLARAREARRERQERRAAEQRSAAAALAAREAARSAERAARRAAREADVEREEERQRRRAESRRAASAARAAETEAEALRARERARSHAASVQAARERGKLATIVEGAGVGGSGAATARTIGGKTRAISQHKRTKSEGDGVLGTGDETPDPPLPPPLPPPPLGGTVGGSMGHPAPAIAFVAKKRSSSLKARPKRRPKSPGGPEGESEGLETGRRGRPTLERARSLTRSQSNAGTLLDQLADLDDAANAVNATSRHAPEAQAPKPPPLDKRTERMVGLCREAVVTMGADLFASAHASLKDAAAEPGAAGMVLARLLPPHLTGFARVVQQVVLLEAIDPTLAAVRQRFVSDHRR